MDRVADSDRTFGILQAGFGKTITTALGMIEQLDAGKVSRWLVMAPLRPAGNWPKEWDDWSLNETGYTIAAALGSPKQRTAAFTSDADVVVTNFDNVAWALAEGLLDGFDGLVIDEISKLKAVGGALFKKLRRAVKRFPVRVGLSATPAAEGARWLYAQALLLDDGAALGTNQQAFLDRYFYPVDYERRNWEPKDGGVEAIVAQLGDLLYCDDGEYDLPRLELQFQPVKIPPGVLALDRELREMGQITPAEGLTVTAANAGVYTGKSLQMASGFVYTDDAGPAVALHTVKVAGIRLLIEHYLRRGRNVLVAYQYEWEVERLRELYPDAVDVRDPGAVDRWNAGEIPVMLIHPKSGGHGLNLQHGGYTLLAWTLPWSLDLWDQLIRRLLRRGQASEYVEVVALVGINTTDEKVVARLQDKLRAQDEFNVVIRSNV